MKHLKITFPLISLLLLSISLFLTACDLFTLRTPVPSTAEPNVTGTDSSWLQIYFTDPNAPSALNFEGGPDQALVTAIDAARLSVDVAAYSLNLWSIRDALIHAHQRGVIVRMIMESDNMEDSEVQDLKDAGIPILGDQREGLMHDKFMVIDRIAVWTGSMNFTVGGTYRDNNNLICIRSIQVAEDYTNEFEEMFSHNRFGPDGTSNTPNPKLKVNGTQVEIYFSPDDGVAKHILDLISTAQESIHFMAYTFTSDKLGAAIIEKTQAGIQVKGVMDDSQVASDGTEYASFMQAGLDVQLDGNGKGLMHHKVIIIDQWIVITGSYNFTASAEENNDENVVVLYDRDAAAKYLEEFQRVYEQATQP